MDLLSLDSFDNRAIHRMLSVRDSRAISSFNKVFKATWLIFIALILFISSSSIFLSFPLLFSSAFSLTPNFYMHRGIEKKAVLNSLFKKGHFSIIQSPAIGLRTITNSFRIYSTVDHNLELSKFLLQGNKYLNLQNSQRNIDLKQGKFNQYRKKTIHRMPTSLSASTSTSPSSKASSILPYISMIESSVDIVLASKSPRRQEIFQLMGIPSTSLHILPSNFPEDLDKSTFKHPGDYAATNARYKAYEVAERLMSKDMNIQNELKEKKVIVGSDTIVDLDGKILEKPKDENEAIEMMKALSGRDHYVHSGVAIFSSVCSLEDGPVAEFYETTKVTFTSLTEEDILAYVATREPFDKAGGYGIQGYGGQFVSSLTGCYFNVMGFPMHKFCKTLSTMIDENKV